MDLRGIFRGISHRFDDLRSRVGRHSKGVDVL
jgi:hypothetical protein